MNEPMQTVEWYYGKPADLTIGEKQVKPVAKIMLILLLLVIFILIAASFYFKDYVYDYVSNPKVILNKNNIELNVGDVFNPKEYVVEDSIEKRFKIKYPKASEVNTSKVGTYKVYYITKNKIRVNKVLLTVNVVDNIPPELELTEDLVTLTRGKNTDSFDPKSYIKSYKDNYDKKEDLKLEYPKKVDFKEDKFEIEYVVTDKSGNSTKKILKVVVNKDDTEKKPESKPEPSTPTPQPSRSYNRPYTPPSKYTRPSTPSYSYTPSAPSEPSTPSYSSNPYISGVHNVTVRVGTSFGALSNQLLSGVYGSGTVSVDYSSVNLTSPGTYTVVFRGSDGASRTAYVTVVN